MPPPTATDTSSPVPGAGRVERLPSGLTIVSETMPGVRSAALGLWVTAGSRCEAPGQEGMAHFWEHLAFKGTAHRSAADIARELDRLGGLANAFTGREETCYHARVAGNRLAPAFEVLSDIVRAPKPSDTDIALEKGVVEQEIAMVEETPEDLAFETFWQNVWSDPGLAHSILGTPESVAAFSAKTLNTWRATSYRPSRLMVCAAGAVDHAQLKELTLRAFGESAPDEAAAPLPPGIFRRAATALEGDSEQAHLILGFPAPGLAGEERYALACLNAALGGQMSSRLFQEVRERRGLAYAISSEHQGTATEGCLTIYAAGRPGARERDLVRYPGRARAPGRRRPDRGRAGPGQGAPLRGSSSSAPNPPRSACSAWPATSFSTTARSAWTRPSAAWPRSTASRSRLWPPGCSRPAPRP